MYVIFLVWNHALTQKSYGGMGPCRHQYPRRSLRRGRYGLIHGVWQSPRFAPEFGPPNWICQGMCISLLISAFSWFVRISDRIQGYALIQYKTQQEAEIAIDACKRGLTLLEQPLDADYAFVQPPKQPPHARGGSRRPVRERSLSPMRH